MISRSLTRRACGPIFAAAALAACASGSGAPPSASGAGAETDAVTTGTPNEAATAAAQTANETAAATANDPVAAAAATITAADMAQRIGLLADDSMGGRDTPSPGLDKAADYLAGEFRDIGLEPAGDSGTFIQRFPYEQVQLDPGATRISLKGGPADAQYATDFFLIPGAAPHVEGPAYYAGEAGTAPSLGPAASGAIVFFDVPGASLSSEWQNKIGAAVGPAIQAGAAGIVLVLDPAFPEPLVAEVAASVAAQRAPVPVVGIQRTAAEAIFANTGASLEAGASPGPIGDATVEIAVAQTRVDVRPPNVVAILPGSDPQLENTYIVLSAHFDHVGVGVRDATGDSIYNGADDNASGTSALVEVAEAFAALPERPDRSVLFLAVSGEEKGLLGSEYFTSSPTVPLDRIIANINMDMIGRNAPDTLIGIGQEYSTFANVLDAVLAEHPDIGLTVIRDPYPEERLFFRSDQLNFVKQDIPALFLFAGLHDDYHKPSDEPERIDTDKAARVSRLVFYITEQVANDPEPPAWTAEGRRQISEILGGGGR
ncbi:MAG: M28 family peptidase [Longimicrobiales bacterium]